MVADKSKSRATNRSLAKSRAAAACWMRAGKYWHASRSGCAPFAALPAMIVDIELDPQHLPDGDIWKSYFASRLAWAEEAVGFRRGEQWSGRETTRECIESSEWIEVDDAIGSVTCLCFGSAVPSRCGADKVGFAVARRRRGAATISVCRLDSIGHYPTHAALALLSAAEPCIVHSAGFRRVRRAVGLCTWRRKTYCARTSNRYQNLPTGIRVRLLETEGRETQTTVAAFRPFQAAWITDFRGNRTDVLSVSDGRAEIDIGPYGWIQIEAEW